MQNQMNFVENSIAQQFVFVKLQEIFFTSHQINIIWQLIFNY